VAKVCLFTKTFVSMLHTGHLEVTDMKKKKVGFSTIHVGGQNNRNTLEVNTNLLTVMMFSL